MLYDWHKSGVMSRELWGSVSGATYRGATYRFEVDIRKSYTTASGRLGSLSFEIANRSLTAGGGYVGLDNPALASDLQSAKPSLADKNTIPGN